MATAEYVSALGRFVWQFARLEWAAVYIAVPLNNDDWATIPLKKSSSAICQVMKTSIKSMSESLPLQIAGRLARFSGHYQAAIRERNGLLHVHPYTAADGAQQPGGKDRDDVKREWTLERLQNEVQKMQAWEVEGNALVHELKKLR